jgi:hypothetical protein
VRPAAVRVFLSRTRLRERVTGGRKLFAEFAVGLWVSHDNDGVGGQAALDGRAQRGDCDVIGGGAGKNRVGDENSRPLSKF